MNITLRQLRYFVAAVDTGKLSSAASECGVSQSAITLALKGLEDQIGAKLLERHASGVTLTYEGHLFVRKAREILMSVAEATQSVMGHDTQTASGNLRIGATYTVLGYFIGPYVARFQRRFPGVRITIQQKERPALEEALINNEIDLAVMLTSNLENSSSITSMTLMSSQRRLWLPPGHTFLRQNSFYLRDIANEPYIMLTVDEADKTALKYWNKAGFDPHVSIFTSSVEAVRTLVSTGMGVTILSDMVYRPWSLEGERIEVRNLDDPVPSMDVGVGWLIGADLPPAALEFRNFLQLSFARSAL